MPDNPTPDDSFPDPQAEVDATNMLMDELRNTIRRVGKESDISIFTLMGCLHALALEYYLHLPKHPSDAG